MLRELFGTIIVPTAVDSEVRKLEAFSYEISAYATADWIEIVSPTANDKVQRFMLTLDRGESEAIAIALERNADYLLIDERRGTKLAIAEGLQTVGLVGILIKAKALGLIGAIKPVLSELEESAGFRIGEQLKDRILEDAGEQ